MEKKKHQSRPPAIASGQCLCGKVAFEIDVPARWAWHDHSPASRRAHGAAYATYVGSWRKRFRITKGKTASRASRTRRQKPRAAFARSCGTPIAYERPRSPHMVNIPRALFSGRTGRQPLYHIAIEELQEWAYTGEPLVPLKGFPGVVWQRSKKKKRADREGMISRRDEIDSCRDDGPSRAPDAKRACSARAGAHLLSMRVKLRCSAEHRYALHRVRDTRVRALQLSPRSIARLAIGRLWPPERPTRPRAGGDE